MWLFSHMETQDTLVFFCHCPSLKAPGHGQHAHCSTEKVEQNAFCCSPSPQHKWKNKLLRSILLSPIVANDKGKWEMTIENAGAVSQTITDLTDQLSSSVCSLCCEFNVWVVLSHGDTVSYCRHYQMGCYKVALSPYSVAMWLFTCSRLSVTALGSGCLRTYTSPPPLLCLPSCTNVKWNLQLESIRCHLS